MIIFCWIARQESSRGSENAIAGADRGIVVTTPEVSAIRDADRIIGLLEHAQIGSVDLIVNRIRADMVRRGDMMSLTDVQDILAVNMIGAIPDDENIVISTNQGEPLVGMGFCCWTGLLKCMPPSFGTECTYGISRRDHRHPGKAVQDTKKGIRGDER